MEEHENETEMGVTKNSSDLNSTIDSSRYQLEHSINYAIGLAVLCLLGGIENGLVLWTILVSKRFRTAYYAFISNLALSQVIFCLVIGIAFGWLRIIFYLKDISPKTSLLICTMGMMPYHSAQVCALLTRFSIGVDRLFAFSIPMTYRARSKCYSIFTLASCWLWPIIEFLIYFGINFNVFRYGEMPMCSGSGWKIGIFLEYTAYRDLSIGGLTVITYTLTAILVIRKFVLIRKTGKTFQFNSKPYQFRLLIASGVDAAIFTLSNMMAYTIRTFVMMHLDGEHRLTANFSVGLLLAFNNLTDFVLYVTINKDFREEFVKIFVKKTRVDNSVSSGVCGSVGRAMGKGRV